MDKNVINRFCKIHNDFTGESGMMSGIDSPKQLTTVMDGEDLLEFCEFYRKSISMSWTSVEENQPNIGDVCLVFDEHQIFSIQKWIEIYEEPVVGMGKVLTGEGWEESEIQFSYWINLPEPPNKHNP